MPRGNSTTLNGELPSSCEKKIRNQVAPACPTKTPTQNVSSSSGRRELYRTNNWQLGSTKNYILLCILFACYCPRRCSCVHTDPHGSKPTLPWRTFYGHFSAPHIFRETQKHANMHREDRVNKSRMIQSKTSCENWTPSTWTMKAMSQTKTNL